MACIKLDDLEITLSEENILLEIKLATMQHYFEICQYGSEVLYIYIFFATFLSHILKNLSNSFTRIYYKISLVFYSNSI